MRLEGALKLIFVEISDGQAEIVGGGLVHALTVIAISNGWFTADNTDGIPRRRVVRTLRFRAARANLMRAIAFEHFFIPSFDPDYGKIHHLTHRRIPYLAVSAMGPVVIAQHP